MAAIHPFVAKAIDNSYVQVAPNIRMAGRLLHLGRRQEFKVPLAGKYQLYSETGVPVPAKIKVEGVTLTSPLILSTGSKIITLLDGTEKALLLPEGNYDGLFTEGEDVNNLFENIYNR